MEAPPTTSQRLELASLSFARMHAAVVVQGRAVLSRIITSGVSVVPYVSWRQLQAKILQPLSFPPSPPGVTTSKILMT